MEQTEEKEKEKYNVTKDVPEWVCEKWGRKDHKWYDCARCQRGIDEWVRWKQRDIRGLDGEGI